MRCRSELISTPMYVPFFEKIILSPLNYLHTCVKIICGCAGNREGLRMQRPKYLRGFHHPHTPGGGSRSRVYIREQQLELEKPFENSKYWLTKTRTRDILATRLSPYKTTKYRCGWRIAIPNPPDSSYSNNFSYCWVSKTGWSLRGHQPCALEPWLLLDPTGVKGQEGTCFCTPHFAAYWESLQQ